MEHLGSRIAGYVYLPHQSNKHHYILKSFAQGEKEKLGSFYATVLIHLRNDWKTEGGSQRWDFRST